MLPSTSDGDPSSTGLAARSGLGIGIATALGAAYALGFHAAIENLIAASEKYGAISPIVFIIVVECALFAAALSLRKFTPWLQESAQAKVAVFSATVFSAAYYGVLGGIETGALAGLGTMVFAAPVVGVFLLNAANSR